MPHLLFAGADRKQRTLLFDTSGLHLRFDQLSGGEREIAFLVGQIDRFGLRNGLFLLDEPELHLNPDLVRAWVTYLGNTVATGQTWLATHSLEAVEAAGVSATILLEREDEGKTVASAASLSTKPVLSTLSRAVGTPAFSIAGIRFVFVEGEEAIGERERFRRVTGLSTDTRFIECQSCGEVINRVDGIRKVAAEAEEDIRIVGVVDRDWRNQTEVSSMERLHNVIVLPVHEVENFFLHPATFQAVAASIGNRGFDFWSEMSSACDKRAGGWILQMAVSSERYFDISDVGKTAKARLHELNWSTIEVDVEGVMGAVSSESRLAPELKRKLTNRLVAVAKIYAKRRDGDDLWKTCEGKEVSKVMASKVGFDGFSSLERAVLDFWEREPKSVPSEVETLRRKIRKA